MQKIDVCVVDDHQIFRKAMMRLLTTFPRIGEVTEAENGSDCLQKMAERLPQVVLLDLEMPVMNGIDCASQLIQKYPDLKIIILTMHDSEKYMLYMLELGVNSFLLKNTDPDELEKAIYSVVDKDFYHNDLLVTVLRKSMKTKLQSERPEFSALSELTPRERDVLRMICEEKTMKEIASTLLISEKTVHTHKLNIQSKLKVKGTVGLIKSAYEFGIIS
jgi:two-component system, NarL family, response regulator DegU